MKTLKHVQEVIAKTSTPAWLSSVPENYGEYKAGSIKADEWRVLCTIYLPLALILVWGEGSVHSSLGEAARCLEILDHTMALFSAVLLACRNTTTPRRTDAYRELITEWVSGLPRLYPEIAEAKKKRPNVHAAFHVYDGFLLFGPMRSWWCFPFERLIGQLQKINTNDRIGGK